MSIIDRRDDQSEPWQIAEYGNRKDVNINDARDGKVVWQSAHVPAPGRLPNGVLHLYPVRPIATSRRR